MAAEVQKIETEVAVNAVAEADAKVEKIKADKMAKVEARCAKRDQWRGPLKIVGKIANAYDREPGKMWAATLIGGAAGAGIVKLVEKTVDYVKSRGAEEVTSEDEDLEVTDEAREAPFDTEA